MELAAARQSSINSLAVSFDPYFSSKFKPKPKKPSRSWLAMKQRDQEKKKPRRWNARSIGFDKRDA